MQVQLATSTQCRCLTVIRGAGIFNPTPLKRRTPGTAVSAIFGLLP